MSTGLTWDGEHYADHTAHHRAYDHVLTSRLEGVAPDADVLDVGCGVGDFTRSLIDVAPRGTVRGVDADPSMIATARQRAADANAEVEFAVCRAQDLSTVIAPASVDLLVSTACLHWLPQADHPQFVAQAGTVLRPGGRLLLEFGGAGQLAEVRGVLDPLAVAAGGRPPTWWFASPDDYQPILAAEHFSVREAVLLHQIRPMADAEALRGWLTSQVLVGYRPWIPQAAWETFEAGAIAGVEALVRQSDGTCDVEYVRLVIDATRSCA
jgi:trans-aconitate 2-methyltransferase